MDAAEKERILAFDVEKAGHTTRYPVIELGAAVADGDGRIVATFLSSAYNPQVQEMEPRCYEEFWSKFPNALRAIKKRTPKGMPVEMAQRRMILGFVDFVRDWQETTKEAGQKLFIVTDNASYDPLAINFLIEQHCPGKPTLPYTFTTPSEYSGIYDVSDMERGMVWALEGRDAKHAKVIQRLTEALPKKLEYGDNITHDHCAKNDAITIARRFVRLCKISQSLHRVVV